MKRYIAEEAVHAIITKEMECLPTTDSNSKQKNELLMRIDKSLFCIEDDIIVGKTK